MRVIDHFSVYQKLPIKIDDIRDFILECGYCMSVTYYPRDVDPQVLGGMLRLVEHVAPYATPGEVHADVIYSTRLPPPAQRLIIAKELLHICDPSHLRANTPEVVSSLIKEINIPSAVLAELGKVSAHFNSDRQGLLQAIAVLLPEEAMEELRPAYKAGHIGNEEIATIAEVPDFVAGVAMSDEWPNILKTIRELAKQGK